MADLVYRNFASTTLAFAMTDSDTTALVADGSVFPDAPSEGEFMLVLEDVDANKEVVRCTARSSNTLTVTRAQEGTTAIAFQAGDKVEIRLTAGGMDEYFTRVGFDGGDWDTADPGPSRKVFQIRRSYANPGEYPVDLYEGEVILHAGNSVASLWYGPEGAVNDGTAQLISPILISSTEPTNPIPRMIWFDAATGIAKVWQAGTSSWVAINGADTDSKIDDAIDTLQGQLNAPAGTKMVFMQDAPPAGWVVESGYADRVIRIVNTGAAGLGGSWTITGMAADNHTLTINEIPAHNHGGGNHLHQYTRTNLTSLLQQGGPISQTHPASQTSENTSASGTIIGTQGGGAGHSHTVTHTPGWRPAYVNMVIARKT